MPGDHEDGCVGTLCYAAQFLEELSHQASSLVVANLPVKMHCNGSINHHEGCSSDGALAPEPFHECGQLVNGEPSAYIQAVQVLSSR